MARFFLESAVSDEFEIMDFLLCRYGNIDFMRDIDMSFFIGLLQKARQKDTEEKLYRQWVGMLPQMAKFMPFGQFVDMATGANIDRRSDAEILDEVEQIKKEIEGLKNGS